MPKIVICDTSCFIILEKIGEIELLQQLYGEITTTKEIVSEYGHDLPEWVKIESIQDPYKQQLLEMQIDKGESSAIALALENPNCTIILDDYKARKIAARLGISFTGTIGIIIKAKLKGIIPSIKPLLRKMEQTNFRLTRELKSKALKQAGELNQ